MSLVKTASACSCIDCRLATYSLIRAGNAEMTAMFHYQRTFQVSERH